MSFFQIPLDLHQAGILIGIIWISRHSPLGYPTPGYVEALVTRMADTHTKMTLFCVLFLLAMVTIWGCGRGSVPPPAPIADTPVSEKKPIIRPQIIGYSVENRPIECVVLGDGPNTTLVIASIHGNEKTGTFLCLKLFSAILENPELVEGVRLVAIPIANPDGYFRNTRYNANNVDLNRNFISLQEPPEPESELLWRPEPETKSIIHIIDQLSPDLIISIHQPLNCIDFDGPSEEIAHYMAQNSALPVRKIGTYIGSLGAYAGEQLGIPIITVELPPASYFMNAEELWAYYGEMLLSGITYPAMEKRFQRPATFLAN